jgi:hypothetical protein
MGHGGTRPYHPWRQVLPGSQSRRCPEKAHLRGQPLQSEARSAKNAPESTICGVVPNRPAPNRPAPTGSVARPVPISSPRTAPGRVGRTNLPLSNYRTQPPCRAEAPRRRVPSSLSEAPMIVPEDILTLVPTVHHVIHCPGIFNAQLARYGRPLLTHAGGVASED